MASNYAKRMARLSARIFGEVARPTNESSMRVVKMFSEKPVEQRPEIVKYYPPHPQIHSLMKRLRHIGLYRDEHADFKEEMQRVKKLKGKGKPPKGEGKRALKRK
ncbi:small ribosomal subunit protein mS33-like [Ptychodera flava]|uniref:small ribosomal subunit protein mS33-like n=1 Tax=Ptychodera flava TaxID=63121 RepID=UPI00396A2C86